MADLSDVQNTLVNLIQTAVYPNGTGNPSIINAGVRIYAGWPIPAGLDSDLSNGISNINVFTTNMERNTTRFQTDWQDSLINTATITLTVSGNTITVGGTISTPQTCMVQASGGSYVYTVLNTDTLNSVAAGIAALIAGATSMGSIVTLPASYYRISARVGVTGTSARELKRQERVFQICVWSNTDANRTTLASAIDVLFAALERISLPDNFSARIKYISSTVIDDTEKQKIYRRDLRYSVEYATTQLETDYTITDSYINSLGLIQTGQSNTL